MLYSCYVLHTWIPRKELGAALVMVMHTIESNCRCLNEEREVETQTEKFIGFLTGRESGVGNLLHK